MKKKTKTRMLIIASSMLVVIGIFIGNIYAKSVTSTITFECLDAAGIGDGTYVGEYNVSPVFVSFEVTVRNQQIVDIVILEHQNGFGAKAESIVDDVLENQSLDVDVVSGATVSSNVILKAIESALQKGRN